MVSDGKKVDVHVRETRSGVKVMKLLLNSINVLLSEIIIVFTSGSPLPYMNVPSLMSIFTFVVANSETCWDILDFSINLSNVADIPAST